MDGLLADRPSNLTEGILRVYLWKPSMFYLGPIGTSTEVPETSRSDSLLGRACARLRGLVPCPPNSHFVELVSRLSNEFAVDALGFWAETVNYCHVF